MSKCSYLMSHKSAVLAGVVQTSNEMFSVFELGIHCRNGLVFDVPELESKMRLPPQKRL